MKKKTRKGRPSKPPSSSQNSSASKKQQESEKVTKKQEQQQYQLQVNKTRMNKLFSALKLLSEADGFKDETANSLAADLVSANKWKAKYISLLNKQELANILAASIDESAEKETKERKIKWNENRAVVAYVRNSGPSCVNDLLEMISIQRDGLAQKLNGARKQTTSKESSPSAEFKTPNKKTNAGKSKEQAFAWSKFQNSPDPGSLPLPFFRSTENQDENQPKALFQDEQDMNVERFPPLPPVEWIKQMPSGPFPH